MNTHPISEEQLMAYLDGETPAQKAIETAAHLEHCTVCQDLAADLQSVERSLRMWRLDAPSPEMSGRVVSTLNSVIVVPKARNTVFTWFQTHALAAFSCAVGLVVLGGLISSLSFKSAPPNKVVSTEDAYQRPMESAPEYRRALPPLLMELQSMKDAAPAQTLRAAREGFPDRSAATSGTAATPSIVRTSKLTLTSSNFDAVRAQLDRDLAQFHGHIAELNENTQAGSTRSLTATLRVPAVQLDAAIAELKKLGHVDYESQRGEEVTRRYIDLEAGLTNLRNTEQRLTEILRTRTGKLSDVLEVEEEISKVRGQIETMQAERETLHDQIVLATVELTVNEEYRQALTVKPSSFLLQIRNAGFEGLKTAAEGVFSLALWLLKAGPTLLLLFAVLVFPTRFLWKRSRRDV